MGAGASTLVTDPQQLVGQDFDYVIIGSGPAGCVLANRLSENPSVKVLLVEAGGNNEKNLLTKVPAAWANIMHTPADWDYKTTPQAELGGRQMDWARGKILGGSTSMNAMMYQTAPPDDMDEWERLGASGWNAKSMATYFRKSEKFTPHPTRGDPSQSHHGDTGSWLTGYQKSHDMTDRFVDATAKAGITAIKDLNTVAGPNGVSHFMTFIGSDGARSSAATAYLSASVRARPNLTIAIGTLATKLILTTAASGEVTCTGAELATSASSPRATVKARKEVIVCSGSVNTPQILMVSGIGPAEQLKKVGITPVVANENVGQHMLDHLISLALFHSKESLDFLASPVKSLPSLVQWLMFGKGPMCTNLGEGAAFLRLEQTKALWKTGLCKLPDTVEDTTSGPNSSDIELICAPVTFFKHGQVPAAAGNKSFTIGSGLLRPKSTGSISVKSANVFDPAIIDPGYFSDRTDIENLVRSIRIVLNVAKQSPLADGLIFDYTKKNDNMDDMYWLADQDPATLTDEQIEAWLRVNVQTLYHPTSTARMARSAAEGVVDSDLRVFGVTGLRVADASVFPQQISAHTTATVIALGEKISDMILAETKSA